MLNADWTDRRHHRLDPVHHLRRLQELYSSALFYQVGPATVLLFERNDWAFRHGGVAVGPTMTVWHC